VSEDVARAVDEAQRTLAKLDGLWDELYSQQFDSSWQREQPTVPSVTPGDRLLHTGEPGQLQRYYLSVQQAVRNAWIATGGSWPQPPQAAADRTIHPAVMRRICRLLASRLFRADDAAALKASMRIQGGWNALPAGIRGQAKGGGARCDLDSCTEPRARRSRYCDRHRYADPHHRRCGCGRAMKTIERRCGACRKHDERAAATTR
jgi:hypothetical protein